MSNKEFETRDLRDPNCHNSNLFKSIAKKIRERWAARERSKREKEIRDMECSINELSTT